MLSNPYIHQIKMKIKREKGNIPEHPTANYSLFFNVE